MKIEIEIGEMEIDLNRRGVEARSGTGALVEFTGIVRDMEKGRAISALRYEAYQPMAEHQMRRILYDLSGEHPCLRVKVLHRIGVVPVGSAAIYIGVEAVHRAEAFALASSFMDRVKRDVPIWKTEAIA
jgi:molybdopterin synthase catalytic subunit